MPVVDERDAGGSPTPTTTTGTTPTTTTAVAEGTKRMVTSDAPWVESAARAGWAAKGLVYLLMGLAALGVASLGPSAEASPQGALARVMERPGGRMMVAVLGIGLLLYAAWRILEVATIAGSDLSHWVKRIGYTLSALVYVALAWTAVGSALRDDRPEDGNTIERASRALLDDTASRVLLAIAGSVVVGVGLYLAVGQGMRRSFADDLEGVEASAGHTDPYGRVLLVAGIAGSIGHGFVVALVGFFVTRSALRYDASDARGFDRALNHLAESGGGAVLVGLAGAGLIAYGAFCLLGIPRRRLEVQR